LFKGTPYTLAERYTELTKILFLAYYYAVYLPLGFFFCTAALVVYYYSDKFCLLRVWAPAPMIGSQISTLSRTYFFTTAFVAFTILSAYAYVHFPTDNLCVIDETDIEQYEYAQSFMPGTYNATLGNNGTVVPITIEEFEDGTPFVYRFCNQYALFGRQFPTIHLMDEFEWLTSDQELIAKAYGWASMIILALVVLGIFGMRIAESCYGLFKGTYEEVGVSQQIDFSNVREMAAYVPMIRDDNFQFPLLTCDIDKIDEDLIGFETGDQQFRYWNLIHDVPKRNFRASMNYDRTSRGIEAFDADYDEDEHDFHGRRTRLAAWASSRTLFRSFGLPEVSFQKRLQELQLGQKWRSVTEGLGLYSANRAELIAQANAAREVAEEDHPRRNNRLGEEEEEEEEENPKLLFSIIKHYPPKWQLIADAGL